MSTDLKPPPPVLRVTSYDKAVSGVIAAVLAIGALCVGVTTVWMTNRVAPPAKAVPVELIELPGGFDDGSVDETLRVDSNDPEVTDASPTDEISEELEIAESLDSVTELSDVAAEPVQRQFETSVKNSGKRGKVSGTGRRALGAGGGQGGIPREQRWFVRFSDEVDLNEYAKQLDFFRIELGTLLPGGELVYLSQISTPKPMIRRIQTGKDEQRLYMTWQGGQRRFADAQLFARSGINTPPNAPLFHFYPPEIENQLAVLERDYRGKPASQIKRTYFSVEPAGNGYRFEVVRQLYID
ncbi:hypothetical protein GC163_05770 [bacterium]|nr:hypothetical protein [bacterium]